MASREAYPPTDPRAVALEYIPDEERRRDQVSVADLIEGHPDPTGEVKLWPLVEPGDGSEEVDGW